MDGHRQQGKSHAQGFSFLGGFAGAGFVITSFGGASVSTLGTFVAGKETTLVLTTVRTLVIARAGYLLRKSSARNAAMDPCELKRSDLTTSSYCLSARSGLPSSS